MAAAGAGVISVVMVNSEQVSKAAPPPAGWPRFSNTASSTRFSLPCAAVNSAPPKTGHGE